MKPIIPRLIRRAALLLPAFSLMLAPLAVQSKERADPERESQDSQRLEELGTGGRGGIIREFNFGPTGMDVILQRGDRDEEDTRLLSGRVLKLRGQTLYIERAGVVVPLDVSALRITRQPKEGQEIIASYEVDRTHNVALSLAGEVEPPAVD